jgi:uncharacterized protein (TIGR02284 family)
MENDKIIAALNELIKINNDRVEGYNTASEETDSGDLISLFAGLSSTSQKNLSELRSEVGKLGGKPEGGSGITGKFFRAWMDVKTTLTGNDRSTILNSCEFGEDKALEAYEHVFENHSDQLSVVQLEMIRKQQSALQADHDKVKALRDAA